jgi:hypothetical protein
MQAVTYWSFAGMGPFVIAIPYSQLSSQTGPFVWSQQGQNNTFTQPTNAPGGRVGAVVGQFLMVGDILQQWTQTVGTGTGSQTVFTASLSNTPMLGAGSVYDQQGYLAGAFSNGLVKGSGYLSTLNNALNTPALYDSSVPGGSTSVNSVFQYVSATDPTKSAFATITANSTTLNSSAATYNYTNGVAQWVWNSIFGLTNGSTYAVTFTGATFGFSIIAGTTTYPIPHVGGVTIIGLSNQYGIGTFVPPTASTINYESGALSLTFTQAPPNGDAIYAAYTQCVPYRVQWSAIGDPTTWPAPLTETALTLQSGYEDLEVDLGPVMLVAGYPLYGVIFQQYGITRASYVGGQVVFSFAVISRSRGLVAHGAFVQVGMLVYFLATDGWMVTDGNSVTPIGTDAENDVGIDGWFFANVNTAALEAIRGGYDSTTRCVTFAIPTGSNTLPDTLLTFNPLAGRWTKSAIPTECIWSDTNASSTPGTDIQLGVFTQAHQYSSMTGPTLNGYLETCDVMATDGGVRYTFEIRPNVASIDTPQAILGTRNSMTDSVNYTVSMAPDPFSRVVPVMGVGVYTRAVVSASQASAFTGATLTQEVGGPV